MATLHIMRERDVGLFSLIQQVIANVPWALYEGRLPIADFRERCTYWTPDGHQGGTSVWEYYFEPLIADYPADAIPSATRMKIERQFPDQDDLGYFVDGSFVTNHFGNHPLLRGVAPVIPFETGDPSLELRRATSQTIHEFVRPRSYLQEKVQAFYDTRMSGREFIGVHIRGTDAVSAQEVRSYRQNSLDLDRYVAVIEGLLHDRPEANIFVATDAQASLDHVVKYFGTNVIAYEALRHVDGDPAGQGPTGCIMPAYITGDSGAAAQNGEDAVVEYLLLCRCSHLVHNGASLAVTALLREPHLAHTNTHTRAY